MRLSCKIRLRQGVEIPGWFRQGILYLIKEALIRSGEDGEFFYRRWYSFNRSKPFTFSAFFPLKSEGGKRILDGEFFKLLFSTSSEDFLIRVYNGLRVISSKAADFRLFGSDVKIESCTLLPEKKFTSDRVKFITLSPFLIRNPEDGDYYFYPLDKPLACKANPDRFKYWVGVEESEFIQKVRENLIRTTGKEVRLLNMEIKSIVPVFCGSNNTSHVFKATYPGIKAQLELQASPEVLKLLYDIGIGARRSEGFGMLEVVEG